MDPSEPFEHEHADSPWAAFSALSALFGEGSPLAGLFREGSPLVPGNGPECMACPICLVLYGLRQARPEVTEHLLKASMELVLAMKAVVDSAAERQSAGGSLRRIPIS
jgi:hypothetical protein